jgi:hypothetical protein
MQPISKYHLEQTKLNQLNSIDVVTNKIKNSRPDEALEYTGAVEDII